MPIIRPNKGYLIPLTPLRVPMIQGQEEGLRLRPRRFFAGVLWGS